MRTSRIGHRSRLRQPGQGFDTQADPQSTRSASLPGTCWPSGGAAAAAPDNRPPLHAHQPVHAQAGQDAARAGKRIVGERHNSSPRLRQLQPNLPIAATCAAMATGGPGGGLLFGFTVVRNAVSTVVVARISSLILPIPEMRAHRDGRSQRPPRSRYPGGHQCIVGRHQARGAAANGCTTPLPGVVLSVVALI
jgi:hypothetical protein